MPHPFDMPTAPVDVPAEVPANADLVERFPTGDDYALASLMEATLGVEVTSFEKLT